MDIAELKTKTIAELLKIAEELDISPKTISTYRTRILTKLSLSNTNQLIHFAMQDNLGE